MYLTERSLAIVAALASAASWAIGAVLFKRIVEQMTAGGITLAKVVAKFLLSFFLSFFWESGPTSTNGWECP
jgi:drug/metabolite transporter (DMT)-like permease